MPASISRFLAQGGNYYAPVVNYSYVVDGRQMFNDVIEIDAMPIRQQSDAARLIARYRPAAAVTIRYNPANPSEAELVGGSSAGSWRYGMGITAGAVAGICLVFFVVAMLLRVGGIISNRAKSLRCENSPW